MIDETLLIDMKMTNTVKQHYIDLGYNVTERNQIIKVKAMDLPKHSNVYIPVVCDYCGKTFNSIFQSVMNGRKKINKDCCNDCKNIKYQEIYLMEHIDNTWRRIEKFCEEKKYELLTKKEDIKSLKCDYISYNCPIHGNKSSLLQNFVHGHGCHDCGRIVAIQKQRHDIDDINLTISSVNGNKWLNPKEYLRANETNLKILCGCCGEGIFTTSFTSYKLGANRCDKCSKSMSKYEKVISDVLTQNNVDFIFQYRIPDCKDIYPLPFDFYLPQYNLLIEFDGEQHINPYYYITMLGEEEGNKMFLKGQYHDSIKTEYCKVHRINLLRISFKDKYNIEKIILNEIKKLEEIPA